MDIKGIIGKLDNPTLGQALGFALTELQYDKVRGQQMFGNLMNQIKALMTQPHFPNLSHVISDLMSDGWAGPVFKGGLMVGIGGWLLDEIDMDPKISQIGKVMKTLGFNAAMGAAIVPLLDNSSLAYSPGHSSSGQSITSVWGSG